MGRKAGYCRKARKKCSVRTARITDSIGASCSGPTASALHCGHESLYSSNLVRLSAIKNLFLVNECMISSSLYQKSFETLSQLAPIETVDQEKGLACTFTASAFTDAYDYTDCRIF